MNSKFLFDKLLEINNYSNSKEPDQKHLQMLHSNFNSWYKKSPYNTQGEYHEMVSDYFKG